MAHIKAASISNAGKFNDENQDSFLTGTYVPDVFAYESARNGSIDHAWSAAIARQTICLAIFDGLGSASGGDYSEPFARLAAEALREETSRMLMLPLEYIDSLIQRYANLQHEQIRQDEQVKNARRGVSFAILCLRGSQAVVYSIGSCRAYLMRQGQLRQLTVVYPDGSGDRRGLPLYYLGMPTTGKTVHFDKTSTIDLQDQDCFMLCSSSLADRVDEAQIRQALGGDDPQLAVTQLLAASQSRDFQEPITVTVAKWQEQEQPLPVHAAGADDLDRPRRSMPHVDHVSQVHQVPVPEKPKVNPDKMRISRLDIWSTMPAWLQIVSLVGALGIILFLVWLLGPKIFG
jgi:serine/threonine protein phosphatase PrpC